MKVWTYQDCLEEAKKYKTRTELYRKNRSAYKAAKKNNWLDKFTWLPKPEKHTWNYENTYKEAEKYSSRGEFKNNNSSAYKSALKNKWLDDYVWFKDRRFDIFKDKIDLVYSYEFIEQKTVYVGRTLSRLQKRRDYQHRLEDDLVSKFAKENNIVIPEMRILETDLTIKEGSENEGIWLELYREDGWNILNIAKTGSIGGLGKWYSKWNYDTCYEEAKKYSNRISFSKNSNRAYDVARKNKWLDDYTWFEKKTGKQPKWSYEKCAEESKKYKTLKDFMKNSCAAFTAATRHNWVDSFVWLKRERVKRNTWSNYENCFKEASKYGSIKEFRTKNESAYNAALKNNWLDEFFPKTK